MRYFERADLSEDIDVNKTSVSKKFITFQYQYFLDKGFKFQPDVCNRGNDLSIMSINLNNIAISNLRGV